MDDPAALRHLIAERVRAYFDAYTAGYTRGDREPLRALADPAASGFGSAAHERFSFLEELLAILPQDPADFYQEMAWEIDPAGVRSSGDVAWAWGEVMGRFRRGAEAFQLPPFRYTLVLERREGRAGEPAWVVVHVHHAFPERPSGHERFDGAMLPSYAASLEEEVKARTAELEQTAEELKKTQLQLVQQEKLASLGALTAGIAHEIKNPLNFINNFADLTGELAEELIESLAASPERSAAEALAEVEEVLADLKQNATKIQEHGRRADSIIRGMLAHARGGGGRREPVEVNRVLAEYADLAYHAARAKWPGLEVQMERVLDPSAGRVDGVKQDLARVFVNLVSNALYAVRDRREQGGSGTGYAPRIRLETRGVEGGVEVRVWDNGGGIPAAIRQRLFEPFMTTKPAGEGTGLGLSLSRDIVAAHGGRIEVETVEGEETTFILHFPALPGAPAPLTQ